ncbi:MAG: cation:proton antiporter [Proteobacteria bacterium]|nr:cation:proton antiporter [Pseudomonadota bacterium]
MNNLTSDNLVYFFFGLSVLLILARLLGEVFEYFGKPAVIGEILAGIILGPTVLGHFIPSSTQIIYPKTGSLAIAWQVISNCAVVLLIFATGLELQLSTLVNNGKAAIYVAILGFVLPFVSGFLAVKYIPIFASYSSFNDSFIFPLFVGTLFSISALPVIMKTLYDLNLIKHPIGVTIIGAAVFDDLIAWFITAIALAFVNKTEGSGGTLINTILLTFFYTCFMLTIGKSILNAFLAKLIDFKVSRSSILTTVLIFTFLSSAFTEWLGIHAMLGALLIGIIFADSKFLHAKSISSLEEIVYAFFSPIFFASIGMKAYINYNFSLSLFLIVLAISCLVKLLGAGVGGILGGFNLRESIAIGFGLNARGAMGIIVADIGFQAGIINNDLFACFVLMSLITSLISGPMMQRALNLSSKREIIQERAAKKVVKLN